MTPVPSKERLLREGVRLMSERGFRETTVGDIEEAAGLTRRAGGFYRHFASKEALLIGALEGAAAQIIGEISLEQVASLKSIRAELILIARALIAHAKLYRPLRLLLQREAHNLPALSRTAKRVNKKLAVFDVVPWTSSALRRSRKNANPAQLGLMIFGPVLIHIQAQDRGDAAFGISDIESFLPGWADHWAKWFEQNGPA